MTDQSKISANLATNIKKLCELRGSTQERLVKLSGLQRPTWASLESGTATPPTLAVLAKAAALQVGVRLFPKWM